MAARYETLVTSHAPRHATRECCPPRSYAAARVARRGGACRLERGPTQALGLRGAPARGRVRRRGGRACDRSGRAGRLDGASRLGPDRCGRADRASRGLRPRRRDRSVPPLAPRADGAGTRSGGLAPRRLRGTSAWPDPSTRSGREGRVVPTWWRVSASRRSTTSCEAATARRRWPVPRRRCSGRWAPTRSARLQWRCGPISSAFRRCGCGPSTAASRSWSRAAGRPSPRPTRRPSAGTWAWRGARVRASAARPIASAAPRPWPAPPDDWAWSSSRTSAPRLHDGFGAASTGEDAYDAFVGLLGVVNVLRGGRAGRPAAGRSPRHRRWRAGSSAWADQAARPAAMRRAIVGSRRSPTRSQNRSKSSVGPVQCQSSTVPTGTSVSTVAMRRNR